MRRKQFLQLITDLRAELRRSSDPAVGVSDLPSIKQTLQRVYETLYDEYDWPHLRQVFDRIPLEAGQRFYDFPDGMDFDQLEEVRVWWNGRSTPIDRGIDFDDYNTYDSESGDRSDPVCKWDVRYRAPKEQFEVWPVPSSGQQAIQFQGITKFQPLVDDTDECRLDDHIVILFAAVELLPAKSPDLQTKLAAVQARLSRKKGRGKAATGTVRLGLGASNRPIYGKSVVRVSG